MHHRGPVPDEGGAGGLNRSRYRCAMPVHPWDAGRAVPTSYYATVQLACDVRIVDGAEEKAALLNARLAHFEPEGSVQLPVEAGGDDRGPDRRSRTCGGGTSRRSAGAACRGSAAGRRAPASPGRRR
ncbi:FMN-binding negative transcriptional regulator [Spirillospora sp. CA-253888]